jgi:dTDP-4-dehydrorhamnose 3,5-epimerase
MIIQELKMIDGVKIIPLKQFHDERGKVMHFLRSDNENFSQFGEIYFSMVYPGAIKGWHLHKRMILNYTVPHGRIKFVLFDDRNESPTKGEIQEIFLSPENYNLVIVPPLIWNGFKGIGTEAAIVANCASIPHDPDEISRLDPFSSYIPYNWEIKHS